MAPRPWISLRDPCLISGQWCLVDQATGKRVVFEAGDRLDVRWPDGHTTGHDTIITGAGPAISFDYHGIWFTTKLSDVQIKRVPRKVRRGI